MTTDGMDSFSRRGWKPPAKEWDMIFKHHSWLKAIANLDKSYLMTILPAPLRRMLGVDTSYSSPLPVLVGSDLRKIRSGYKSAYLALLINDRSGDGIYLKDKLFSSLQDHEYDEEAQEIRLKGTDIVVHIGDCISGLEHLSMNDPRRLFHKHQEVSTLALYYNEDTTVEIGSSGIGAVQRRPMVEGGAIRDIFWVRLRLRDYQPIYRVFISKKGRTGHELTNYGQRQSRVGHSLGIGGRQTPGVCGRNIPNPAPNAPCK